jgi:hypothetical protein
MTLSAAVLMFALSQTAQPQKPQEPRKVQQITFDEDVIEGTLKGPDLEDVTGTPACRFSSLIKVRDNFADKIVKSVDQL